MNGTKPFLGNPFATALWTQYRSIKELPCLTKADAFQLMAFGFGVCGVALTFLIETSIIPIDRLLASKTPIAFASCLLLLGVTLAIAVKQWHYYFGGPSKKDGIFVERPRQASETEKTFDALLSAQGGLLLAFALTPASWFLLIAIYSFLVILRCHVTLKRWHYWEQGGSRTMLAFIPNSLVVLHNGLLVGDVVAGWTFSHCVLMLAGIAIYVVLKTSPHLPLFFALSIVYFTAYFVVLRPISARMGKLILRLYGFDSR